MKPESIKDGNLLIVEDNPTNLSLLFDYLTQSGFKVFVALDGESAIEQVEYAKPDIILLDVMMPGMDGFETCDRLKANPSTQDIPVIFMTALSDTVDKVRGFQIGAVDYITKPIQPEEVLSRIQTQLMLRNLQKKLQEQNERLQHESNERQRKALELEQALQKLQQTQVQLIQAEKMSSLGKMVAGVAHEINNPISFIYGNLDVTNVYTQQLLRLIELYQKTYTNPTPEIATQIEAMDLEFLESDLPKLLNSMKVGTERICQIVQLLRNFSRSEEAQLKLADIHEGIDSALLLLQHRLEVRGGRAVIQVIKKYGNLPQVECYAGQLNQVFINILANAIDAIEDGHGSWVLGDREESANYPLPITNDPLPTIQISTELREGVSVEAPQLPIRGELLDRGPVVVIRIRDNGPGMTEYVRRKVFDPFFTTKPVGSGTGLGLAISYQIVVEKHRGQLLVNSEMGKGTEFVIEIPLRQSDFWKIGVRALG